MASHFLDNNLDWSKYPRLFTTLRILKYRISKYSTLTNTCYTYIFSSHHFAFIIAYIFVYVYFEYYIHRLNYIFEVVDTVDTNIPIPKIMSQIYTKGIHIVIPLSTNKSN